MFKTTNGGTNWMEIIGSFGNGVLINDEYFINNDTGWYCDSNPLDGGLWKTTNGGVSWVQQLNQSYHPLKLFFLNKDTGWVGTNDANGKLYRTTNGGTNWNLQYTFAHVLNDVKFYNSSIGWTLIPQSTGGIYKTTNGGFNWTEQQFSFDASVFLNLKELEVINSQKVYLSGGSKFYGAGIFRGILFKTTNGGINWGYQLPDTSYDFVQFDRVDFINDSIGWAYGPSMANPSRLAHTKTGGGQTFFTGIEQISITIPSNFKLYQNYPNPFNPETTIEFELKKVSDIKLEIFDITGRTLDGIAYKMQSPGKYQYLFRGENLTSGVYFYRLTANNNIIDTKKMLLVK